MSADCDIETLHRDYARLKGQYRDLEVALSRSADIHAELSEAQHRAEVRLLEKSREASTLVQCNQSQREQITEMSASIADLEDTLQRVQRVFEESRRRTEALLAVSPEDDLVESPPGTPRPPGSTLFDGISEYFSLIEGAYRRLTSALKRARRRAAEAEAALQAAAGGDELAALQRENRRTLAQHALDITSLQKENASLRSRAQRAERDLAAMERRTAHETDFAMRMMTEAEQAATQAAMEATELRTSAKVAIRRTRRDSEAMAAHLSANTEQLYADLASVRQRLADRDAELARQRQAHEAEMLAELARREALEAELAEQRRVARREAARANEAMVNAIGAVDSINHHTRDGNSPQSSNAMRWMDDGGPGSSGRKGSRVLSSPRRKGVLALPRTSTYKAFKEMLQAMQDGMPAIEMERRLLGERASAALSGPSGVAGAMSPLALALLRTWLQGVVHGAEPAVLSEACLVLSGWAKAHTLPQSLPVTEARCGILARALGVMSAAWQFFYGSGGRCEAWCETAQPETTGYGVALEQMRAPFTRAADAALVAFVGSVQARLTAHLEDFMAWTPAGVGCAPLRAGVVVLQDACGSLQQWGVAPPVAAACNQWLVEWLFSGVFNTVLVRTEMCTIDVALRIRVAFVPLMQDNSAVCRRSWIQRTFAPLDDLLRLIETAATRARESADDADSWTREVAPSLSGAQVCKALSTMAPSSEPGDTKPLRSSLRALEDRRSSDADESVFWTRPSGMPVFTALDWGEGTQEQFDRVANCVLRAEFEKSVLKCVKAK